MPHAASGRLGMGELGPAIRYNPDHCSLRCLCPPAHDWASTKSSVSSGAGAWERCIALATPGFERDVALKMLPDVGMADVESRIRFDREARALASLNHPNIAAIYSLEENGPVQSGAASTAIIMELVDGEMLADRLSRSASAGRGAQRRRTDRRGARGRTPEGNHPSRSEAGKREDHARRHGEGA